MQQNFKQTNHVHVGVGSLNQTVGDWEGNRHRIISIIQDAHHLGVKLLLLPELAISGYSLGDRLPRAGTLQRSYQSLLEIKQYTKDMIICLGLPITHQGVIYNAVAVVADQSIVGFGIKEYLATGDVEYENRWYQGWSGHRVELWTAPDGHIYPIGNLIFEAQGIGRFAFEIHSSIYRT